MTGQIIGILLYVYEFQMSYLQILHQKQYIPLSCRFPPVFSRYRPKVRSHIKCHNKYVNIFVGYLFLSGEKLADTATAVLNCPPFTQWIPSISDTAESALLI